MNRKLKALGLALFAAFAMSAVAASGASAVTHDFESSSTTGTTYLTAEALSTQQFYAKTGNSEEHIDCSIVNVNGSIAGTTTDSVTVEPIYEGCKAFKPGTEVAARVKPNGCHYLFTGITSEDVTGKESAEAHLTCPEGVAGITIDLTIFHFACVTVPPQTLHGITYKNNAGPPEDITLEADVHGIKSVTTESTACTAGEDEGLYKGNVTVKGFQDEAHKEQVNITTTEK